MGKLNKLSGKRVSGLTGSPHPFTHSPVHPHTKHGFTLIELMIVIVIIAAMAAMIVPRLSGRSEQAKIVVAQADISSNISMGLKLYELDNGSFPSTEEGVNALYEKPASATSWRGPYLEKKSMDPWGNTYQYKCPGVHNSATYDLYSLGKDGQDGTADDVKNWE
ncbi:MAG: type II secretion system major pseudopilin GspG [Candidatus Omnitrophica bacterium]|nr:type II secretion system major pseudopilin GspG [Candidatus Omnitrophota bacterium]